uniref:NACHT domain-containing protein n=1 Tax=Anopheles gambiae TaxID=7165 RepID=A0A453YZS0_ANOGA
MATKDGVDFQHHLYYYVIGLVHNTYDYSILYEGNVGRNQGTYKALDDVILKINPNRERGHNEGLYLFQAKQRMDESLTLSIQDMLHHKVKISKYIDSYVQYSKSEACSRDGKPTEMIYWTSDGLHSTTLAFMEEHTSKEPHLKLTIDTIGKYSIKHWKALLMFDTAQKLANHCTLSKQDMSKPQTYLSKAMAQSFAHEIIEMMEPTAKSEQTEQPIVKFREQFLQGSTRLSENAKQFRLSFIIACQMQHRNPNTKFDLSSLRTVTFSTDAFQMQNLNAESAEQCGFQYNGLEEDELNWFFEHFIFYVNVPKNEKMITAINNLFHNQWDEHMFHKYLIKDRPETKKDKKLQQVKALVESIMKMKELKSKLVMIPPKGIDFKKESLDKLCTGIETYFLKGPNELTILSRPKVEWTTARIQSKYEKHTVVASNAMEMKYLLDTLNRIKNVEFGDCLISGEVKYILLLHAPGIAEIDSKTILELVPNVKLILIVEGNTIETSLSSPFITDDVVLDDVIVNYEHLELKRVNFDAKDMTLSNCIRKESIDSSEKLAELSTLKNIVVKSDFYEHNEQNYIERSLIGDGGKIVTHSELILNEGCAVSIICDTAGQGKTVELLRIAKIAHDIESRICLYIRAKTIAKSVVTQAEQSSSLEGLQLLQTLLYITPQSALIDDIVNQCLVTAQVCLLIDGFDEIVETYQTLVIKFLQKILQCQSCLLILATRNESVPILRKAFKNAFYYNLATFPYEKYFKQLWLSDANPDMISPEVQRNVDIFISNFDQLLKGVGCKSFLEVPQLCKIMGIIYQDRIRKPNIQWHTNYEIGSIYNTFLQSQFENTVRGKFDEMDKLHVLAKELIQKEFYAKHSQLACELEYNCCNNPKQYEQMAHFGLIMIQLDASECVDFMHRTVMEYFLVRNCLLDDVDREMFFNFLRRYFCVSRANIADKFIDFFLHDLKCLTSHKKHIISSYLYSSSNILATCIRMALNNATFNTLRMLLSVAPKELLRSVHFRFGGTNNPQGNQFDEKNEINLKRLGERQTILLLETLKECDDEYDDADNESDDENEDRSILQRMLFETNPDEEDTLEVALRKPFPEVFDWFVAYCTEHFSLDIQRYLTARIPRYARTIIRHCYAENKEKIIDKLIQLCAATLRRDFVRDCFQSFDLLGELINSIESVPQGKQFKEADRLDLTQKVISLLDLYQDNETLLLFKEQSKQRVESLQNEAIRSCINQWIDK